MNEYSVFAPVGQNHLAATITVPDGDARAMIGLFQGSGGAPRSHRHAVWTRTARMLCDRGFASVRVDWPGVGDSPGEAFFRLQAPPIADALGAMRFAMDATGVQRVGVAGNCLGARAALGVAETVPQCESIALIMLKPLAGRERPRNSRNPRSLKRRLSRTLERLPMLERVLRRWRTSTQSRRANPLFDQLRRVGRSARVLLMEEHAETKLRPALTRLQRLERIESMEVRDLPGGTLRVFDDLERQEFAITSLVEWFDSTFPREEGAAPEPSEASERVQA